MKNLFSLILIVFLIVIISCGESDECMQCTGTTANGESADYTICKNDDGTTTRTDNINNTAVTDSIGYAEGVVFFESAGLTCN